MVPLETLVENVIFRSSILGWLDFLDLLLVTLTFYGVLELMRRSRVALLLRGVLTVGILLFIFTLVLELPTFDWIVRGALVAVLIATPITLQPELRRWLERVGGRSRLTRAVRQTFAERLVPLLVQTVNNLAGTHTGALLVIQGEMPLDEVINSGVRIDARVTPELLQTIFFEKTPLHDGAVVLREDEVVAAACILPLSQRLLMTRRRLGTRHRAAVGLSEVSDATVIIVSEETGAISFAQGGELTYGLESSGLRDRLFHVYLGEPGQGERRRLVGGTWPGLRQVANFLGQLLIALLLALLVWGSVLEQTDPTQRDIVANVPLTVIGQPENSTLRQSLPAVVDVTVQSTASILETLNADSFAAIVSFEDVVPGLARLPIDVTSSVSQLRILGVDPPQVDVELVEVVTRTLPVEVIVSDRENVSLAYELGPTTVTPQQALITGPSPQVQRVVAVQAAVRVGSATTSVRETRALQAVDLDGAIVAGVSISPQEATVNVTILRRRDALDVGVRAVIEGTPPAGYWVSGYTVLPTGVTLRSTPGQLLGISGFVDTAPIDVSQAVDDFQVDVPLALLPDVAAVDAAGNRVTAVTVRVQISPRTGDLLLEVPVQIENGPATGSVVAMPDVVEVLLTGPIPQLNEIADNPLLVRVIVDAFGLTAGAPLQVTPTIVSPTGVAAQLVTQTLIIQVRR